MLLQWNANSRHRLISLTQASLARNNVNPLSHPANPQRANHSKSTAPTIWPSLLDSLQQQLTHLSLTGSKVLLAVSGGADSVAMLRLWVDLYDRNAGWNSELVAVAHYNHRLRGAASDLDEQFVCDLARERGLRCYVQRAEVFKGFKVFEDFEVFNDSQGSSQQAAQATSEAALREARYRFLQETAEQQGARCVVVAHTADDNVETMLHHLFRGSGAAGLAGIAPYRDLGEDIVLMRPLLGIWRAQIRSGLVEIGQSWREDASNQQQHYQRNWIRGSLLPLIRERYPLADEAILRAIQSQAGYCQWTQQNAVRWIDEHASQRAGGLTLRRNPLDSATLSAVVRLLWIRMNWPRQSLTTDHLRRLQATLGCTDGASFTLPGDIQCRVEAEQIELRRGR